MSFTKLLRLIKFARPPARLLLSETPTRHPHVTGEQHLGIIPLVSLGSSLNLINLPCFSCFSIPAEGLSRSRGLFKLSNLNTRQFQHHNDPRFVLLYQTLTSSARQSWCGTLLFHGLKSGGVPEAKHEGLLMVCCSLLSALAGRTGPLILPVPQMDSPVSPLQWTVSVF